LVTYQLAANQVVSGSRVALKIVPAVTEVSFRQPGQRHRPRASFHA
jgi:hypothetical protein